MARSFGYGRGQLQLALLEVLRTNGPMRSSDLAEAVQSSRPNVSTALTTMFWRHQIDRDKHGTYYLPTDDDYVATAEAIAEGYDRTLGDVLAKIESKQ